MYITVAKSVELWNSSKEHLPKNIPKAITNLKIVTMGILISDICAGKLKLLLQSAISYCVEVLLSNVKYGHILLDWTKAFD